MVNDKDIKRILDDITKERKFERNKEYLDFIVDKFCYLENREVMEKEEYSTLEKEAFMHGFYVAAGGAASAIEDFIKKEGGSVTSANKAQETFEKMVDTYPTKAALEEFSAFYEEMKDTANEETLLSIEDKIEKLEESYTVRNSLETQFSKGKKYGKIFSVQTPFLGVGYTGMDIVKYLKDGGYKDVADRFVDLGGLIKDKGGDGLGKVKDFFTGVFSKKKKDEE